MPTQLSVLRPELRAGYHLYPGPDGAWRLAGPDDSFLRLTIEPDRAQSLASALRHDASVTEIKAVEDLLAEMDEQEFLRPAANEADLSASRIRISCAADSDGSSVARIASWVECLLRRAGVGVGVGIVERAAKAGGSGVDLVIEIAPALPDSRWIEIDAWCEQEGIAWHRCHLEGESIHLGPLTIPGRSATYRDLRARRLAASEHADELEALWRFLDGEIDSPRQTAVLDVCTCVAVAATLVSDVIAFLRADPLPAADAQRVFDQQRFDWRQHPVLPLPRGILDAVPR